jgi:ABC-type phosphate transport system permease subunit
MGFLRSCDLCPAALIQPRTMNLLKQLISDGEMPSTMRVLVLLIVGSIMIVWTVLSIKRGEFVPFPVEQTSLVIAALGAKAWQARSENPAQPQPPTT